MIKILMFLMVAVFSFSYDLMVLNKKDSNILKNIGFNCVKQNENYVCLSSNNIDELKRVKEFLKSRFNINTLISNNEYIPVKNKSPKQLSVYKFPKKINGNYCIQISSFKNLNIGKKLFEHYKKFPFARIEKIGNFYTLRVGEGSYSNIKNLTKNVNGFLRKCNIIPQRIVMSNFDENTDLHNNSNVDNRLINSMIQPSTNSYSLKEMYNYLNNGSLIQAKEIALKLKSNYPNDANLVLGLVAMKQGNFKNACNIFSSLRTIKGEKLKKDACYTYYIKAGFNLLKNSPKRALFYFNKALRIKPNDKDALLGKGYAYTNLKKYQLSYNLFKNLYKKYPNNIKILEGYINVLYLSKRFDELDKLQSKLPDNLKNKVSSIDFYMQLKKAQHLMDKKKYNLAEKILINLYTKKPDDVNLLLTLANLYLQTNQLDKALNYYNNVLIISPDNIYALKGLEVIYMKKENYVNALKYSNKIVSLGFQDKNKQEIKKLYYISVAKSYLKENKINQAKIYLEKAYNIDKKDPLVLALLGDIAFKEKNNDLAYSYYAKSYTLGSNNFGIKLKFLYALLKLNLFDQIKIILSRIDTSSLNSQQVALLRKFYIDLYAKYATYLLNNKECKKALKVVNNGLLMDENNYTLLSTKAWICLKLKKYECAKKYFKLALQEKDNNQLKYGLALVYINEGDKEAAKNILDSIQTNDKDLKVKIAGAYVRIGEIDKAKNLLRNIDNSSLKTKKSPVELEPVQFKPKKENNEFFPNPFLKSNEFKNQQNISGINQKINFYSVKKKIVLKNSTLEEYKSIQKEISEIEQNYISNITGGFKFRSKTGGDGTSKLKRISFPYLEGEYFINNNKKILFVLDGESLNSGNGNNSLKHKVTGISGKIGFESNKFKAHIGITPIGTNTVSSTVVGDISGKLKKNVNTYYLKFYRDSFKDTLTSYVGNIKNNTKFSRVLKNGVKLGYKKDLDKNGSFLYTNISFNYLNGKNIKSNTNIGSELLYLHYIGDDFLDRNFLGIYANLEHYNNNQSFFDPPYGGYFSPKLFLLAMPRYEGYLYSNDRKFMSKLTLMAGGNYIDNWSNKSANFSYDVAYNLEYLLTKRVAIESGFDFRNSNNYSDVFFTLMFRYYFGNKSFFTYKDIDKFSQKVVNW